MWRVDEKRFRSDGSVMDGVVCSFRMPSAESFSLSTKTALILGLTQSLPRPASVATPQRLSLKRRPSVVLPSQTTLARRCAASPRTVFARVAEWPPSVQSPAAGEPVASASVVSTCVERILPVGIVL